MPTYIVNPGFISAEISAASHEDAVDQYLAADPLPRGGAIGLSVWPKHDWSDKRFFEAEDCIRIQCARTGEKVWWPAID